MIPLKENCLNDSFGKPSSKEHFKLVLIDLENTFKQDKLEIVTRCMCENNLEYIAISYRWGEFDEQLVKTPDYTAQITSMDLKDLKKLCYYIYKEPDLKAINYIWLDTISVNQLNDMERKNTIRRMSEIYEKANYILAVPDLHYGYLITNPANIYYLELIAKYKEVIYSSIVFYQNEKEDLNRNKIPKWIQHLKDEMDKNDDNSNIYYDDICKAYGYLKYLMEDWSNRAWVLSECYIAKENEIKKRKPLKYIFISLLPHTSINPNLKKDDNYFKSFFSHSFDDFSMVNLMTSRRRYNHIYDEKVTSVVDCRNGFIKNVNQILTEREHIDKLLNSKATRSEDRFYAILPSWGKKYKDMVKDENQISKWEVKGMSKVIERLYGLLDNDWDKIRILWACSEYEDTPIIPTYASHYNPNRLFTFGIDYIKMQYEYNIIFHKKPIPITDGVKSKNCNNKSNKNLRNHMYTIHQENIFNICLKCQDNLPNAAKKGDFLELSSKEYFLGEQKSKIDTPKMKECFSKDYNGELDCIFIPFVIKTTTTTSSPSPTLVRISNKGKNSIQFDYGIYLIGNFRNNEWILYKDPNSYQIFYNSKHYRVKNTFKIY
ncbi:unnamed protein product [Cunninghamella blakesleeana]